MSLPFSTLELALELTRARAALTRLQSQATADLVTIRDLKARLCRQEKNISLLLEAVRFVTLTARKYQDQTNDLIQKNRQLQADLCLFLNRFDLKILANLPLTMPLDGPITVGDVRKIASHLDQGEDENYNLPLFESNSL